MNGPRVQNESYMILRLFLSAFSLTNSVYACGLVVLCEASSSHM